MKRHAPTDLGNAFLFACMTALGLGLLVILGGCDVRSPTAPSVATPQPIVATSQVTTWPDGLWLEHVPTQPGVTVCITQPRTYCKADGSGCASMHDFYTVRAPEVCPAQPIE